MTRLLRRQSSMLRQFSSTKQIFSQRYSMISNTTKRKLISFETKRTFVTSTLPNMDKPITVTFIEPDGEEYEVQAEIGDNFLDVAHDNDIELEGACGGELACSTCHVILEKDDFDKLEELNGEMDEEEEDMLDLALGLTDTSRLACQVCASPELDGMRLTIPEETADMR
jgi:ferredoxin